MKCQTKVVEVNHNSLSQAYIWQALNVNAGFWWFVKMGNLGATTASKINTSAPNFGAGSWKIQRLVNLVYLAGMRFLYEGTDMEKQESHCANPQSDKDLLWWMEGSVGDLLEAGD
jgi:hypothetical protein